MDTGTGLFTPLVLRGITLKNRIIVSPMCQYSAEDGFPTDWHRIHYGSRAVGGAGMIILEATAVRPEGRISWADLGIWDDKHGKALGELARLIEAGGAVPAIQLAHGGRKASTQRPFESGRPLSREQVWPVVSSTDRPFTEGSLVPRRLEEEEIASLVDDFASAAARAVSAGFRAIEIHAAHGYLLHQFLSPLCNDRTDSWGGGFDSRTRFLREVVAAVRASVPGDIPVLTRVSSVDWKESGWTVADTVRLAGILKNLGVDLLDCSSGGIIPGLDIPVGPGYQVEFAAEVKEKTGMVTGAVGMITESGQADDIISSGKADAVLLGREMLRDPYWPRRAAKELGVEIDPPAPYSRAWM